MASPDFKLVRNEISDMFDELVTAGQVVANLPHRPLSLNGSSPVIGLADGGFRPLLAAASFGQYDLGYVVTVFVNQQAHGAAAAADHFDDVRKAAVAIITDLARVYINFEALEMPSGQWALTYPEIIDGIQYLVGEIPVIALNVVCQGET